MVWFSMLLSLAGTLFKIACFLDLVVQYICYLHVSFEWWNTHRYPWVPYDILFSFKIQFWKKYFTRTCSLKWPISRQFRSDVWSESLQSLWLSRPKLPLLIISYSNSLLGCHWLNIHPLMGIGQRRIP